MEPRVKVPAKLRKTVFARAGHCCEYCQTPEALSASPFVVEHILPLAAGGKSTPSNLACACHGCNLLKSDHVTGLDGLTGMQTALFHPRRDNWCEHFRWSHHGEEIIPLTSTGRATIHRLDLNRTGLRNLRRLLRQADKSFPRL
jgi:hypothetical protein